MGIGRFRSEPPGDADRTYSIGKNLLLWAFVAGLIILLVWVAWDFLFLSFGALLFAILLSSSTDWVVQYTSWRRQRAFALVTVVFAVLFTALTWLFADTMIDQSRQMADRIPKALAQVRDWLQATELGRTVLAFLERGARTLQLQEQATALLQGIFEAASGIIVIVVVGFFLALEPDLYRDGLLRLFPPEYRLRASIAAAEVAYALRWWLLAQFIPMTVLGITTFIGLRLLDVPLAFVLSLLTAILIFIPYLGAVLSEIPAVLVALVEGPVKAIQVLALYIFLHIIEAYIVTPLAQHRAARLPPVVALLSQALLWTTSGVLGVALAAPLAAAAMALVRNLYLNEEPSAEENGASLARSSSAST